MNLKDSSKQMRHYARFFEWTDKPRKELGIVEEWLKSMSLLGDRSFRLPGMGPSPNAAPDCVARTTNDDVVGIEVTELVSQRAVELNQKGKKVYRDWTHPEVHEEIERILKEKDSKTFHGGPYGQIVVLIHTDELVISYSEYKSILGNQVFSKFRQINKAFFLFSYEPEKECCPFVKLNLSA